MSAVQRPGADDIDPNDFARALAQMKQQVRSARNSAARRVNTEMIGLHWRLGRLIRAMQDAEGYGTKVIARLSGDLREEFPDARGFSPGNLDYMRRMAVAWPDEVSLQLVGKLGWGHIQTLIDKFDDADQRDWYAAMAAEHGWSRNTLVTHIATRLRERAGAAPNNFTAGRVERQAVADGVRDGVSPAAGQRQYMVVRAAARCPAVRAVRPPGGLDVPVDRPDVGAGRRRLAQHRGAVALAGGLILTAAARTWPAARPTAGSPSTTAAARTGGPRAPPNRPAR